MADISHYRSKKYTVGAGFGKEGHCSLAEVAAELKCSPEHVRRIEYTALLKLREALEEKGFKLSDFVEV